VLTLYTRAIASVQELWRTRAHSPIFGMADFGSKPQQYMPAIQMGPKRNGRSFAPFWRLEMGPIWTEMGPTASKEVRPAQGVRAVSLVPFLPRLEAHRLRNTATLLRCSGGGVMQKVAHCCISRRRRSNRSERL
jgi:hypothetical protein